MKLASYGQRVASKDLFDIVQVVQSYDQGSETAARLFRAETEINPAYAPAIRVLKDRFAEVTGKAAVHYADFCVGAQSGTIPAEDYRLMRQQYANTAVTAGILLLSFEDGLILPSKE